MAMNVNVNSSLFMAVTLSLTESLSEDSGSYQDRNEYQCNAVIEVY